MKYCYLLPIWVVALAILDQPTYAQLAWSECGIALPAGPETAWDARVLGPHVIRRGDEYQLWYGGWDGEDWRQLGRALPSTNPCAFEGSEAPVVQAANAAPALLDDPQAGTTRLWYGTPCLILTDGNSIRATDVEGQDPAQDATNALFAEENWELRCILNPVILHDGTRYHMWFDGGDYFANATWKLGHAASVDGFTWEKDPRNPVVETIGEFGSSGAYGPSVLYDSETDTFEMWYTTNAPGWIVYATSMDGGVWAKQARISLPNTESVRAGHPSVLFDAVEGTYEMWYNVGDRDYEDIAYATSEWTVPKASFVLEGAVETQPETWLETGAAPLTVTLNAEKSRCPAGRDLIRFVWDCGDAGEEEGQSVDKVFDIPGDYRITLTVTDSNGNVGSVARQLRVLAAPRFRRGDANQDAAVELADGIFVLTHLFLGGVQLDCPKAADTNDDGTLGISDASFLLNHLFLGGPPPPDPGTGDCGEDPTPDALDCAAFVSC